MVIAAALAAVSSASSARAQDAAGFVPLEVASAQSATRGQVAFFPVDAAFSRCLPLSGACPPDSSSLVFVPAASRRLAWLPANADLPEVPVPTGVRFPAVGSPPGDAASAGYLVPLVDAAGMVTFAPTTLRDGGLVAGGGNSTPASPVVPVLVGPNISGGTPAGSLPEHLFDPPEVIDASTLRDAVPVLLVRRAPPTRIVFGIRAESSWGLALAQVPLVSADGVAMLARRGDTVGVAAPVPAGTTADTPATTVEGATGSGTRDGEGGDGEDGALPLAAATAAGAAIVMVLVIRRRR